MQIRQIERIVQPQWVMEGAGVKLQRTIASQALDYLDPFLLLDHFGSDDPSDYLAGFPMHPHRGIETVTYMLAGQVTHEDSLGNKGDIGPGDVQWMTAGGGIMHEEMPRPLNGKMAGFQLWVNLPSQLKMMMPRYQEVLSEGIPSVDLDGNTQVRVIAGQFNGERGPVTEIAADPTYLDISLAPGIDFEYAVPQGHTVFAYVFEGFGIFGSVKNDVGVQSPALVVLGKGDTVAVQSESETLRFLLVAGKPLGEPVARYGPFVMNTDEEIRQALQDLRAGTFVMHPPD